MSFQLLLNPVTLCSRINPIRTEMSAASRVAPAPQANLATYIERSLEFLWLLTAALVPLIFVPTDWMLSEAVNAYVEVPKTTGLRALVGLMTILWILEWVVKGGLGRGYNMARFPSRLRDWLVEQPSRWVVVAATFYLLVAMITTALSQARWISLWGEVSGQFGYSLYTTVSYFLLFAIISTHLKTSAQLWRLLGVIVATGALVALYGIVQHFNLDPLDLGESGYVRVASTMANSVFAGAFLVGSSLMTIGVGLMVLDKMGWTPVRAVLWVALVAAQLMAVYWTGARGSWVIGVPLGLFAFLVLAPFALGPRAFAENSLVRVLGLISILIVALIIFVYFVLDTILWGVPAGYLVFLVLSLFALGPLGFGSTRESLLVVASVLVTVFVLSLVLAVYLILETFLWQALLGSFVFLLLLGLNFQPGTFGKTILVIGSGLLVTIAVVAFTPAPGGSTSGGDESNTGFGQVRERLSSVTTQVTGRGISYRTDIWDASAGLIVNRPWFEYEDLSFSFIRPLVGYGPEMFKYTFPMESPLGGMLSHAHNFWIHHAVEQGILGFFSSAGLFVAFIFVGVAQLWTNRNVYSTAHKWILVTLLATMVGRMAELMVGVARESDLVLFWIMLAIFVILPTVMNPANGADTSPVQAEPPRPVGRRERRVGRMGRSERWGRRARRELSGQVSLLQATGIVLVSAVVIFIGWLTWDKNIDYAWAAALAASARDDFQKEGNYQESAQRMSKAIDKAPDVPIYYHNLAGIYEAYGTFLRNNPDQPLESCAQFFSLEPGDSLSRADQPFARCFEEAYRSNLAGFKKNPTSPQVKLVLANSALDLAVLDYEGKDEEAIRHYRELTAMLPSSWPLHNALGTAHLRLGQPQEALEVLDKSLSIIGGRSASAQTIYLKGLAYRRLDELTKAIDSFERSLAISSNHPNADNARRQLASAYDGIAVGHLQENTADRAEEALAVLDKYLALPLGSNNSARPLYLQGVAYQQLDDLDNAAASLVKALSVDEEGPLVSQLHQQLAAGYAASGDQVRADEHRRLFRELDQPKGDGDSDIVE